MGVVHRLDRPTTGIVVFAKTSKVLPRLNSLFADKDKVMKKYWAVLEKNQLLKTTEILTHWLVRNPKQNKSKAYNKEVLNGKKSILQYRILQTLDKYYLVEVQLFTGRHHQIRSQFSTLQCPIKGDVKYGAKRTNSDASIHLHAHEICFLHPVKKEEIHIIAPIPDLWKPFV